MAGVSLDELRLKIPSKFNLVMVAAKRARQIKDGAPRLIATHSVNPVTIALEEIAADKIVLEGGNVRVIDDFPRPSMGEQGSSIEDLLALPEGDDLLSEADVEEISGAVRDAKAHQAALAALSFGGDLEGAEE